MIRDTWYSTGSDSEYCTYMWSVVCSLCAIKYKIVCAVVCAKHCWYFAATSFELCPLASHDIAGCKILIAHTVLHGGVKPVANFVLRSPIFRKSAESNLEKLSSSWRCAHWTIRLNDGYWIYHFHSQEEIDFDFKCAGFSTLTPLVRKTVPVFSVNHVATECNTRVHQSVHHR